MKGTHIVTDNYVIINQAIMIFGAGRDQTIVKGGGIDIRGTKEEGKRVWLVYMTISHRGRGGPLAEAYLLAREYLDSYPMGWGPV